jgi:cell wall-associated NlpC family hydrolase
MTTPPNNNVGSSRLLGTDDAQRAVDSLTRQVHALERAVANAARAFQSAANTTNNASGRTGGTGNWNVNSNFPNSNGGTRSASFSNTGYMGGRNNGGGGSFSGAMMMGAGRGNGGTHVTPGMGRLAMGGAIVGGIARGLVNYGNKNMSTNMQMDMFGNYSALSGGIGMNGYQATNNVGMRTTFVNNNIALGANDAARGGYTAAYTFGAPQYGGYSNQNYVAGTRMAAGFAYASPTIGYAGAMNAAQQTYSSRAFYMSQAMGLAPTIGQGGVQNSMGNIAQSMMSRTFQGRSKVSQKELDSALRQGGSLSTNMAYWGSQMGWSSQTTQTYENYIRGLNAAQNKGMSRTEFDRLTQIAATGNGDSKKDALSKLKQTTGMGASMFERQRDLNATRLTRQEDILESLAPAFEKATNMVDKFSEALTKFLQVTHLDSLIGTGSGWASAISGGLSGMAGGFGMGMGAFGAARLLGGMGGGAGGLGTLFSTLFGAAAGRGGAGAAGAGARGIGGLIQGTRGASGAYNITNVGRGATAARAGGLVGGLTTAGALFLVQGHSGGGLYEDYLERKNDDGYSKKDEMTYMMQWLKENKATAKKRGYLYDHGVNKGQVDPDKWDTIKKEIHVDDNLKAIAKAQKEGRLTTNDGQPGGASTGSSSGKKSKSGGSAHGAGTANAASVIGFAEQQLGDPYVWGGVGPDGWDCSGLIQWAYKKAGVKIPRTSQEQQKIGKAIPTDKVQPGDLLFNGSPAHHVVMAIGNGKVIEAPHPGANVRIRGFKPGEFTNARRILGSVGDMSGVSTTDSGENTLNDQASTVGGNIGGGLGGTSELAAIMAALGGGLGAGATGLSAQATSSTSTSDSSSSPVSGSNPPGNPKGNQAIGKRLAAKRGWTGAKWKALYNLWTRESGWNEKADNPTSDAYGIPQALPGRKMASAGSDWKTNPETQIKWGLQYIEERYGDPAKAWSFWNSHNPHWYDQGAWNLENDTTARVHKGEMILPAKQAESVRNAIVNTMTTGTSTGGGGGITFAQGSIVVQPMGPMTQQEATMTGKMIVDAVCEDARIKQMQKGH